MPRVGALAESVASLAAANHLHFAFSLPKLYQLDTGLCAQVRPHRSEEDTVPGVEATKLEKIPQLIG
jgi:hypothetical protein